MSNEDLKEKQFEADIEQWLLTDGGYTKGDQKTYDKERAIDMTTLIKFLASTQEQQWDRYSRRLLCVMASFGYYATALTIWASN